MVICFRTGSLDPAENSCKLPLRVMHMNRTTDSRREGTSRYGEAAGLSLVYDGSHSDLDFPQREAAFFYGLFLRGHSVEELRRDIEVPEEVLVKWQRETERQPDQREQLTRMLEFRRHVLAIFDSLVGTDLQNQRVQ